MEAFLQILSAVLSVAIFSGILGLCLAIAAKKLKVAKDEIEEEIAAALPGLNCGACSYAGCESYAGALASGTDKDIAKCTPGGSSVSAKLSDILDIDIQEGAGRMVARLACRGAKDLVLRDFNYQGYADCEAAVMHFGGEKGCKYSCLGLGSCVKICPVKAISYTADGLVKVDESTCISCGKCAVVCPTGAMKMIPADTHWFVACNSRDNPKTTKTLCKVGCIGCRICEKRFPQAGFAVTDNLASWTGPAKAREDCGSAAKACPTGCIIKTV